MQGEPRKQREQGQIYLNYAESRSRSTNVNAKPSLLELCRTAALTRRSQVKYNIYMIIRVVERLHGFFYCIAAKPETASSVRSVLFTSHRLPRLLRRTLWLCAGITNRRLRRLHRFNSANSLPSTDYPDYSEKLFGSARGFYRTEITRNYPEIISEILPCG